MNALTTNACNHPGEAAALRAALRLTLAALQKALADGCAIQGHDCLNLAGQAWSYDGICAAAADALDGTDQPQGERAVPTMSADQCEMFEQASDALADAEHCRQRGDFKAARLHAMQYLCHVAMLEKLAILQGDQP